MKTAPDILLPEPCIRIQGARHHNLKNIDVEIPHNQLTVVTGLSGSGKSTLAFDTLYAEGQRRYVESLSTYARQFLGQMDKPRVDNITGLSPAIAIEQKALGHNPRSTVGTITDIHDFLRLVFARIGTPVCHLCQRPITSASIDEICDQIMKLASGTKIILLSPLVTDGKGTHERVFSRLKRDGFARVRVDREFYTIEEVPSLKKNASHCIEAVVDRLVVKPGVEKRLADSLELGFSLSQGQITLLNLDLSTETFFSETASCPFCHVSYPEFTPASFSFNSPHGACPHCKGLGSVHEFDPDRIVPDPGISLRQGAVMVWQNRSSVQFMEFLDALTSHYGADIYQPFGQLPEPLRNTILYGSGQEEIEFYAERAGKKIRYKRPYEGVIPNLARRYANTSSRRSREQMAPYMSFLPCPHCHGSRLNPASSAVQVGGKTLAEISDLCVTDALAFFESLSPDMREKERCVARPVFEEIAQRLGFLEKVGLGYLTLGRSGDTLSGGENRRIRLATQIGSRLMGVLYVLDEPSIGLHQRDNEKLLSTLMNLRDLGNTVLVVEHDPDTILAADHVIDIGPGAGERGGELIFSGPPEKLLSHETSLTGLYLSGKKSIPVPRVRRKGNGKSLSLNQARANNLKGIDVSFPLGCLTCVTGVSGSGKSSLVTATLYPGMSNQIHGTRYPVGKHGGIQGMEHLNKLVFVDQSPIGKTPRSNPATYTKVFPAIREIFARTRDARAKGYKPGRFSFNIKGGRCEACKGDGIVKIEMHFLPDVYVTCDVCRGRRYNRETLDVRYKGKNIADIMDMTVYQALEFFDGIASIKDTLAMLAEVGLGYIRLGQGANTLSGGEAQRMRLARELSVKVTGNTLYILDEPTTGLHPEDIRQLMLLLNRLVDAGNTVVVIEHNLDVIKCADHIIDLGPEGGDDGGRILGQGTPEQITALPCSHTGQYLKSVLV